MRHELTDYEWAAIKPFLPNKPRGVPRITSAGPYLRSMPFAARGHCIRDGAPHVWLAPSRAASSYPPTPRRRSTRSHSEAEAMTFVEAPSAYLLGVLFYGR
jgi:transposase